MRPSPMLSYLALRTVLLLAVTGLLAFTGLRGVPLVLLALVFSSVLALPLLSRQRDAVSMGISGRMQRTRARLDEAASSDDD